MKILDYSHLVQIELFDKLKKYDAVLAGNFSAPHFEQSLFRSCIF